MKRAFAVLILAFVSGVLLFGPGCSTSDPFTQSLGKVVSPERVEAVCAYAAGRTVREEIANRPASREVLTRVSNSLQALVAEEDWDLVALAVALDASGLDALASEEGVLLIEGALIFNDLFTTVAGRVTRLEHVRAVIVGTARGFAAALARPRSLPAAEATNFWLSQLRDAAVATR